MRRTRPSCRCAVAAAAAVAASAGLTQLRRSGRAPCAAALPSSGARVRHCATAAAAAAAPAATAAGATDTVRRFRKLRLAVVRPDVLDDWIPELNDVDAQQISCEESVTPVWWRCPGCQAKYQCTVQTRVARGRMACPSCGGAATRSTGSGGDDVAAAHGAASPATSGNGEIAKQEAGAASTSAAAAADTLDRTHPDLAARWDVELNGALQPSHVTASSRRLVWWLPEKSTASTASSSSSTPVMRRSFRRPVFAFVRNSASPAAQAAATAEMEWKLLHEIRRVAHIDLAEEEGAMPVAPSMMGNAERKESGGSAPAAADLHVVCDLWKSRVRPQLLDTQKPEEGATASAAGQRPVFLHTEPVDQRRWRNAVSAAAEKDAMVRGALLSRYADFVVRHRKGGRGSTTSRAVTPVLASLAATPLAAAAPAQGTKQVPLWTEWFTLSAEEAAPKGRVDPNASLYFPEVVGASAQATAPQKTPRHASATAATRQTTAGMPGVAGHAAVDSLLGTPQRTDEFIITAYPRRPPPARLVEDDVLDSTPAMVEAATAALLDTRGLNTGTSIAGSAKMAASFGSTYRIQAPFGRQTSAAKTAAAQMAAEYDDDDADAGAAARSLDHAEWLATELRTDTDVARENRSRGSTEQRAAATASLVDSAIAALGAILPAPDARGLLDTSHGREMQWNALLADATAESAAESRTEVVKPRRFRLFLPQEAPRRRRSRAEDRNAEEHAAAAAAALAAAAAVVQAPQSPRKVARSKRAKKASESTEETS